MVLIRRSAPAVPAVCCLDCRQLKQTAVRRTDAGSNLQLVPKEKSLDGTDLEISARTQLPVASAAGRPPRSCIQLSAEL